MGVHVLVAIDEPAIRAALAGRLALALRGEADVADGPLPGGPPETLRSVVVAGNPSCTPGEAAALVAHGWRVVVVVASAVTSGSEQAYRAAGVSGYLPMDLDLSPLLEAIRSAASG